LPAPVGISAKTSLPAITASTISRWSGRNSSKPKYFFNASSTVVFSDRYRVTSTGYRVLLWCPSLARLIYYKMIALLRGAVRQKSPFTLVLDANGVGYEVLCTQAAFDRAPSVGTEYELWTRLVVREDSMTLFGFASPEERALFDQLI